MNTFYSEGYYTQTIYNRVPHGYYIQNGVPQDVTTTNVSWAGAAGGMLANARDLVRWLRLSFMGGVLQEQQLNEMESLVCNDPTADHCVAGQPVSKEVGGFGLGLIESYLPPYGEVWNYKGQTLGYTSFYLWVPTYNTVIGIVISSGMGTTFSLKNLALNILSIIESSSNQKRQKKT